jgi:hypothetical protein
MPAAARTPALGYIRVSSYLGRDRREALTEDVQLEKIKRWCAVADLELVDVLRDMRLSPRLLTSSASVATTATAGGEPAESAAPAPVA